jgi:hypothetical protein
MAMNIFDFSEVWHRPSLSSYTKCPSRQASFGQIITLGISAKLLVGRSQKGMQRCDNLRALADSRGDPLDRTRPDVTDGEDAPAAGLQRAANAGGVSAGQHEPLRVQRHAGSG